MGDHLDTGQALAILREQAGANERARQLTPESVEALRSTGVFRMAIGKRLGGPELDPLAQIELLEQISEADASAGWCAMIGSDGGYATAFLEESVAKEMYSDLDVATALNANPTGQAKVVDGGYEVSGRWAFGSGSTHSAWLFLHCMVFDADGSLRMGDGGIPVMRMCAVPAADARIVDTWHTTGLAGSGSHDVEVSAVVVPDDRTFSLLDGEVIDPSPLYRWRWMFFINLASVPLGLGRAVVEQAKREALSKFAVGSFAPAAEDPVVATAIARAEALVGSARSFLFDTAGDVWDAACADADVAAVWPRFRVANTNAFHAVKQATNLVYEALGTSGVYARSPLDRHYRDIATMTQHVLAQPKTWVAAGRALMGLDPQSIVGF